MEILIAESKNTIKWFSDNKMIVNPNKFKSITVQKTNQTIKPKQFLIGNNVVEIASSVKLLGIHIMFATIALCVLKSSRLSNINPSFVKEISRLQMTNRSN